MNAYQAWAFEPEDGACLVFAPTARKARLLAWPIVRSWTDAEWTDLRVRRIVDDAWLFMTESDWNKVQAGEAHAVESPTACARCYMWGDGLNDAGLCEDCSEGEG